MHRRAAGWLLTGLGLPSLTYTLTHLHDEIGLSTVLLLYLALVVAIAATGGTLPAVVAAACAFLLANYYFTAPLHRWSIGDGENVIALVVFLSVALIVSHFVDTAARRALDAAYARSEARTLAGLAATIEEDDPLPLLLAHLRTVLGLDAVAVLRETAGDWEVDSHAGDPIPKRPDDGDMVEHLAPGVVLSLVGRAIAPRDHVVLNAFASRLAEALEHRRLRLEASHAQALAEANALRSALLQAVSHDLRTPLAAIKASASSLRAPDVKWSDAETAEFVQTIDEETDRLTGLVANLLDMSRIQAGVIRPALGPVLLEEVVPAAIKSLGAHAAAVHNEVPDAQPPVLADAVLLERAIANVVHNAVRASPADEPVRVEAGAAAGFVDLRIVDRGRGIPVGQRRQVFEPFQRLGDNQPTSGVGLGLAVADGFLRAMGATADIEDTPGGGTTFVMRLRVAE
ncbi:MAG: sensor histidine kinase [Actinomycetota bacterium]